MRNRFVKASLESKAAKFEDEVRANPALIAEQARIEREIIASKMNDREYMA